MSAHSGYVGMPGYRKAAAGSGLEAAAIKNDDLVASI